MSVPPQPIPMSHLTIPLCLRTRVLLPLMWKALRCYDERPTCHEGDTVYYVFTTQGNTITINIQTKLLPREISPQKDVVK